MNKTYVLILPMCTFITTLLFHPPSIAFAGTGGPRKSAVTGHLVRLSDKKTYSVDPVQRSPLVATTASVSIFGLVIEPLFKRTDANHRRVSARPDSRTYPLYEQAHRVVGHLLRNKILAPAQSWWESLLPPDPTDGFDQSESD